MVSGPLRQSGRAAARWWADLRAGISTLLRVSSVRYSLLGLAAVAVLIAAMIQMASVIVDEWSQRDVELRARLVFRSIHERVVAGLAAKAAGADLKPFFEQLVEDERLQALAFCDPDGGMLYATKDMPSSVHCPKAPLPKVDTFNVLHDQEPPIAIALFPLAAKEGEGSLLVVHDLSFIDQRAHEAEFYMALALIGVAAGLALWRPRSCSRWSGGTSRCATQSPISISVAPTTARGRRKCRSGGTSRRCCPSSGSSESTPTAFTSNGRRHAESAFWPVSCPERR